MILTGSIYITSHQRNPPHSPSHADGIDAVDADADTETHAPPPPRVPSVTRPRSPRDGGCKAPHAPNFGFDSLGWAVPCPTEHPRRTSGPPAGPSAPHPPMRARGAASPGLTTSVGGYFSAPELFWCALDHSSIPPSARRSASRFHGRMICGSTRAPPRTATRRPRPQPR